MRSRILQLSAFTYAACLILSPRVTLAQEQIEVHAGGGYLFGDASVPSLTLIEVGAVGWLSPNWGISITHGWSIGRDWNKPPVAGADRMSIGRDSATYTSLTLRRRHMTNSSIILEAGGGLTWGHYDDIETSDDEGEVASRVGFGGLTLELLVKKLLTRRLALSVGTSLDVAPETTDLRSLGALVVRF